MAVQFVATGWWADRNVLTVTGQLLFSGSYVTGGDSVTTPITIDNNTNTAGLPDFHNASSFPHVSRPPVVPNVQVDAPYIAVFVPGSSTSGAFGWKIKFQNPSGGAELAAGAYPASISGSVYNYITLIYKANL